MRQWKHEKMSEYFSKSNTGPHGEEFGKELTGLYELKTFEFFSRLFFFYK